MVDSRELGTPSLYGNVSMYIPFNLTSGGWNKGVVPKLSYTITNDIFNTGIIETEISPLGGSMSFAAYQEGTY